MGNLSQVITSDINNIPVKRRRILRKSTLVLYICGGVTVDFDVVFMHLQPRGKWRSVGSEDGFGSQGS